MKNFLVRFPVSFKETVFLYQKRRTIAVVWKEASFFGIIDQCEKQGEDEERDAA